MRGRDSEWRAVERLLRTTAGGTGGTLLIEGEPGAGKSLLVAEAAARAVRLGLLPVVGGAEEVGQFVPLAPLFMALGEVPRAAEPVAEVDLRVRLLEQLRVGLEKRAASHPVVVALDDLQWADHTTLAALRTLQWEVAQVPVAWILARATGTRCDEAERLFEVLGRHGAGRIVLGPLPGDAVAAVVADVLGAVPRPDLLAMAEGAGGNPFLLGELLAGLREEDAVEIDGGRAGLRCAEPPRRVRDAVGHRLAGLRRETRHLVEAAAVLGRSFGVEDAAELLGAPPAALLPAFEEAVGAGILTAAEDALEFRHELVWRTIVAAIPSPVRNALHHQIGKILLDRGGSPVRAAGHLVEGSRPGDPRTLTGLDQAVSEALSTSPGAAAELAVQAVRFSDLADPGRVARMVTAIQAMTEAGRLAAAEDLARSALAHPAPGPAAAELRRALSGILLLRGQVAEAVTEAETALGEPTLAGGAHDRAVLALLRALAESPDTRRAAERAEGILAGADHGEAVRAGALVVLARVRWDAGRLAEGVGMAREAVRRAAGGPADVRRVHPRLVLAPMLAAGGLLDEAARVAREAGEEVEALDHGVRAPCPAFVRARVALAAGRPEEAVAQARAGLDLAESLGTRLFVPLAAPVLGTVALRRGDLRTAARYAGCAMVGVKTAEAGEGPGAAMEVARPVYAALREGAGVLAGEPGDAAWLVRLALAAGERACAGVVVRAVERLAAAGAGFPAVRAAALHARGLLDGDRGMLARAAETATDPWNHASAAEDLGVLLAGDDPPAAIRSFDRALTGFDTAGAGRDAARLRRRLRRLGVRHRHWTTAERPVTGWESLTDTECMVSSLVTQGWTNRQVADQMFISAHTVAFHLRQIFRKLGICSRVELTRLTIEAGRRTAAPDTPYQIPSHRRRGEGPPGDGVWTPR
ncbi:helix-turn-helix transcriptional regulator [Sphaerisporangium aureirubrum]|uniref:AAA family ATPase n=1 Tax=Sphaerisporangium aureirubrum TaxID=1544736 RepID=A0ABW1N8J6_9ACTN